MKKLFNAVLVLILILGWATPALAQEGHEQPGQVLFGTNRELLAGDVINGDLVIFGGNLRMADGSRVEGDVVIFGGNGNIDGEIQGDMATIGGNASLGPTAKIEGDVASVGGQVHVDEGASVEGEIIETTRLDLSQLPLPPIRPIPPRLNIERDFGPEPVSLFVRFMTGLAQGLLAALVVAGIGLLVVLFLPHHTQTIGRAIRQAGPTSFGVGLLTLIVGITVMILLTITCCLIPVALLVALGLALGTLYGWIVVGYLFGARLLGALQKDREAPMPVASALVGVFALTLLQQGIMALSHIPCLGFFFWLLGAALWLVIAATGLGAVVLTRFGTQSYAGAAPTRTPPPALPPTPGAEPTAIEAPPGAEPESDIEPGA